MPWRSLTCLTARLVECSRSGQQLEHSANPAAKQNVLCQNKMFRNSAAWDHSRLKKSQSCTKKESWFIQASRNHLKHFSRRRITWRIEWTVLRSWITEKQTVLLYLCFSVTGGDDWRRAFESCNHSTNAPLATLASLSVFNNCCEYWTTELKSLKNGWTSRNQCEG